MTAGGAAISRRDRATLRREHVIRTAARLLARDGYHATSMQALADEAGVSVGSLYQYVENKADLLLVVITTVLEEFGRGLPAAMAAHEDPVRALAAGFRAYCEVIDRNRDTAVLAYRETKSLPERSRRRVQRMEVQTTRPLVDAIAAGQRGGVLDAGLPAELAAYNLVVLAQAWALKHWRMGALADLERFIATQTALGLRGLLVPGARPRYRDLLEVGPHGD